MSFSKKLPLLCLGLSVAFTPLAQAQNLTMAVGNAGQLHRTLPGAYGELFPEGGTYDAATPVLTIEIDHPTSGSSRVLVPGTGDSRVESAPRVFHDARYDTVTVLWSSSDENGSTQLRFASYDGEAWSEIHTLEDDGNAITLTGEPLIAVTDDAFDLDLGEESAPLSVARRILHVLWRDGGETPAVLYAPLTFVANRYIGWSDPVALDETLRAESAAEEEGGEEATEQTVTLTPALAETLGLRPADDDHSVLVTFTDSQSQRLGTAVITPLSLEIDLLGDMIRDEIFAQADLYDPEDMTAFADEIRAGVVIIGHRFEFHPSHVDYLAGQMVDWLLASGGAYGYGDFEGLGNDARDLTIDVSSEVYTSLVADPSDPGSSIQRIDLSSFLSELEEPQPAQIFDIRLRSNRPAPAIGDGRATVFSSRDGRDLLVAWEDEEAGLLYWVESRHDATGGAWSEAHSLLLGESLPLADAHQLLAQKVR